MTPSISSKKKISPSNSSSKKKSNKESTVRILFICENEKKVSQPELVVKKVLKKLKNIGEETITSNSVEFEYDYIKDTQFRELKNNFYDIVITMYHNKQSVDRFGEYTFILFNLILKKDNGLGYLIFNAKRTKDVNPKQRVQFYEDLERVYKIKDKKTLMDYIIKKGHKKTIKRDSSQYEKNTLKNIRSEYLDEKIKTYCDTLIASEDNCIVKCKRYALSPMIWSMYDLHSFLKVVSFQHVSDIKIDNSLFLIIKKTGEDIYLY